MLRIGDFSRLSRVSIRMLRYYDETGLLKPDKVDDFAGYRYYSEEQLIKAGKINALKDMGFGVNAIADILKSDNPGEIEQIFQIQKDKLLEEADAISRRIQFLDTALERLRKDEMMKYDCIVKQMPERYVASVRKVIPKYEEEGRLWHILFSETAKLGMTPCGSAMAKFHDKEYKERDVDVEVQIEVKGHYKNMENVVFFTEPETMVASTVFQGSYDQFPDVYASLAAWVFENGYEFAGPMMDVYHVSPHETQNPDEFVTEVCCPIQKRQNMKAE